MTSQGQEIFAIAAPFSCVIVLATVCVVGLVHHYRHSKTAREDIPSLRKSFWFLCYGAFLAILAIWLFAYAVVSWSGLVDYLFVLPSLASGYYLLRAIITLPKLK